MEARLRAAWCQVLDMKEDELDGDSHFFQEGGDSVAAIRLIAVAEGFKIQLDNGTIYGFPLLRDMASNSQEINTTSETDSSGVTTQNVDEDLVQACAKACKVEQQTIEDIFPATKVQANHLAFHKRDGSFMPQNVFQVHGPANKGLIREVVEVIRQKNQILRTRIVQHNDTVYQVVVKDAAEWYQGTSLSEYQNHVYSKDGWVGYGDPLFRYAFIEEARDLYFVYTSHHAGYDGWTNHLIFDALEEGLRDVEGLRQKPVPAQYKQYSEWLERRSANKDDVAKSINYWRSYLDGFQFTDRFDVAPGHIANPTGRLTKIMRLKKQASAFSLATMAHAAWAISLGNIYQCDDIMFWAVTSGRRPPRGEPLPGIETIMGPVPNGVHLRIRRRTDQTIGDLVQETQDHMISTIPHQRGFGLSREIFSPLYIYQTNFNWHSLGNDIPARIIDFENLDGSVTRLEGRRDLHIPFRGPIPFILDIWEHPDHLRVVAKWDQKLYDEDRVALMLDQLIENLRGIASAKAKCVGDLWKIQDSMNNETINGHRCDDRKLPSVTQEAILDSPPPGADSGDKFRTKCEEGLINLTLVTIDPSSPAESASKPSIIVPGEKSVTFSWFQLEHEAKLLQQKLAATSDFTQKTISMALPNSVEVVCLFLAITRQRGIAALLNPSNKEIEFDFYLEDMKSVMVIVPKGAYDANSDVVRAAKRHGSRIAECYWDGQTVVLDVIVQKERTNGQNRVALNTEPLDTDIALLLHTGGTTRRPKAVSPFFQYTRYMFDASLSGSIDPQKP